jgi:hypothetical protein
MEKEFIPYEQASDLKELEFDEPCICFQYDVNSVLKFVNMSNPKINSMLTYSKIKSNPHLSLGDEEVIVPTFSQAFRWFREKHSKDSFIARCNSNKEYFFDISWRNKKGLLKDFQSKDFKTHPEAELECLKKLIEICKNK